MHFLMMITCTVRLWEISIRVIRNVHLTPKLHLFVQIRLQETCLWMDVIWTCRDMQLLDNYVKSLDATFQHLWYVVLVSQLQSLGSSSFSRSRSFNCRHFGSSSFSRPRSFNCSHFGSYSFSRSFNPQDKGHYISCHLKHIYLSYASTDWCYM